MYQHCNQPKVYDSLYNSCINIVINLKYMIYSTVHVPTLLSTLDIYDSLYSSCTNIVVNLRCMIHSTAHVSTLLSTLDIMIHSTVHVTTLMSTLDIYDSLYSLCTNIDVNLRYMMNSTFMYQH